MIPDKIIQCGGHENGHQKILTAGSLSMTYENGSLRHIVWGGKELIRMIYMAVRDRDWLTPEPEIENESIGQKDNGFIISYSARYRLGKVDFRANVSFRGKADSSLELSFHGEALNTFEKNRIGFCVLHPVKGVAEISCTIIHPDYSTEDSVFPELISPHQPFRNIAGMEWRSGATNCRLEFQGDIFETEDQRNWTDASFKTYSTPLSLPFPVRVEKGWTTSQKILFKADTGETEVKTSSDVFIELKPDETKEFPSIGIGRSSRPQPLEEDEIGILKKIKFKHCRCDLYLFKNNWKEAADLSLKEARNLRYPVAFALFFSDNYSEELSGFITWLGQNDQPPAALMIFHKDYDHTPANLADAVSLVIMKKLPGTPLICGTNANFAQLNRNRHLARSYSAICWSVQPQEHASDNLTLIENLEGQGYTVRSAVSFSEGKDLWVSPVNIKRRFNANRENYETPHHDESIPSQIDTRIMSLFGAGWTAGSIRYLAEEGVNAITYFETAGERGIIQGDYPPQWIDFPSKKGMIFPVYFVFRFISEKNPVRIIKSVSSHPLLADSLVFSDGKNISGVLFNLTSSSKKIMLKGIGGQLRMKLLDKREALRAVIDPDWLSKAETIIVHKENINLPPFSLSFVEF